MENQAPPMLKPALISGLAFGVAGAIPVINWINCACCALIIGCGFLAAFLYSKDCVGAGAAFRPGNGATVGLLSGLIYGVVSGVLGGIIKGIAADKVSGIQKTIPPRSSMVTRPVRKNTAPIHMNRQLLIRAWLSM